MYTLPDFEQLATGALYKNCLLGTPQTPVRTSAAKCDEDQRFRASEAGGLANLSDRTRRIQQKFFVTEDELNVIEEQMRRLNTENKSAYLRKMAMNGYIINVDMAWYK